MGRPSAEVEASNQDLGIDKTDVSIDGSQLGLNSLHLYSKRLGRGRRRVRKRRAIFY